jgi:hypothetical protein
VQETALAGYRTASNSDITLHLRGAEGGIHFKTAEKNRDHETGSHGVVI